MPAVAPPAMPKVEAPKVAAPAVSAPAGQSSNILLIVIFCLLAFLAGGVVVYLLTQALITARFQLACGSTMISSACGLGRSPGT